MRKFIKYCVENIYEGTYIGVIIMTLLAFSLVYSIYNSMQTLGNYNGRICNYSGKFWIDDTKDKTRDGDLKGCFTWEEMIEMDRL